MEDSRQTSSSADVLDWALRFLPEYFTDSPAAFHSDLLRDLANDAKCLMARVAPRGHAKSTCAAFAFPLWCICQRRRTNIVILTHESALATQFVSDIRRELETNDRILDTFGDLCASSAPRRSRKRWSGAFFTTATGITVQAKSVGGSLRGTRAGPQRPDLIVCDDIEKDELVAAPEGRAKLEHWLRRVVLPALAPRGKLVVLGSILHYDSLLANLVDRKRFPRWDYRVYRAIEAELADDGQYYKVPLWPARWPLERLDEERERVGTLAFEQEYMANPIDETLRVFRPEWLRRYAPEELVGKELTHVMTVDPATGKAGGDYFAIWVGAVDVHTGVIYTRALQLERIGIVDQIQRVIAAFQRWQPVQIGIETVAYQVALKQILDDFSRRTKRYLPLVELRVHANKRARIEGVAPFFENGTLLLPQDLDPEAERQFLHFPKARHDDAPDVCAMGIGLARDVCGLPIDGAVAPSRNRFHRDGAW